MTSQIDITKPVFGTPTTQSVRDNFTTAANEISNLQQQTVGSPFLPLAGSRMTGPMYLFNDPTDAMMPATKGYVDAGGSGGGGGIPEAPPDGSTYGRQSGAWVGVLPTIGGKLTGPLDLAGDPTDALGAVTKQYADAIAASHLTDAPNDANTYGRHANAWAGVLPITGGQLTGSLGVGLPLPAALSTTIPHLFAGNISGPVAYNAYTDTTGASRYRTTGIAAGFSFSGSSAAIYCAPSGTADAALTWGPPFLFDAKGNFTNPGGLTIPTDANAPIISGWEYCAKLGGHYSWNIYAPTPGTHWTYLSNGYGANIFQDSAAGAFQVALYPSGSAGGSAPTSGPLWSFQQNGQLSAPGMIYTTVAAGFQVKASSGHGMFGSYDQSQGVNWGFWSAGNSMLLGVADINNNPGTAYATLSTANLSLAGNLYVAGLGFGLVISGSDRVLAYQNGYYLQWYIATGTLAYVMNGGQLWVMQNTGACFNNSAWVGGHGAYQDLSDRRAKANIKPSTYGLAELSRLEVVEFDRIPMPVNPQQDDGPPVPPPITHHEIGFIAQDVQPILPEAVRVVGMTLPDGTGELDSPEPSLGMSYQTVLAVAVNAIKEIDARLRAKEI